MLFKPGEAVPQSGIYEAIHRGHRESHPVTAAGGGVFPECNICNGEVRFRFVRPASPIEADEDFR
ncbi:MAG TPA: hypothetical protein VLA96_11070 [Terriglobales bacterium]|nr:hypothetical protein [Terriglobales bacterium]